MKLNIYLNGVGGQGIGVLSELIIRAYDHAGFSVKGVDTHGLAQRGGSVESHIRIGYPGGSPLIENRRADVVLSLERTEAFRALVIKLRPGGALAYYDTSWQSLPVRLGNESEISRQQLEAEAEKRAVKLLRVCDDELSDVRLQNIKLLADAVRSGYLPGIDHKNVGSALADLFGGASLQLNLGVLNQF